MPHCLNNIVVHLDLMLTSTRVASALNTDSNSGIDRLHHKLDFTSVKQAMYHNGSSTWVDRAPAKSTGSARVKDYLPHLLVSNSVDRRRPCTLGLTT